MFTKKPLDYLFLPKSTGKIRKQRLERVEKEKKERKIKKMRTMRGKDSEEDILKIGKRLKDGERIGIVTFPLHFKEYENIIKKAQQQGKFPRAAYIEGITTNQTFKEFVYGILGLAEEKLFEGKASGSPIKNSIFYKKFKSICCFENYLFNYFLLVWRKVF